MEVNIDLYRLYTIGEVSELLKLSTYTIKYYIDKKDIKIVTTEQGVKVRGTEIVRFRQVY